MNRVRFAPSPTGFLHIGGARTCLFNWLHARATGGQFVLRIEDTDQERSKKEYLEEILTSLKWLGLDWDELYFQSERFDIYRQYAQRLLEEGKAYLADDGSNAVLLKMPQETVEIPDMIHGVIRFDAGLIKDQVLIKSDQSPTYNFACVIDDALMTITHIIRGDDHISNTPKQMVIYKALGFAVPQFAHIPMILGKGGGRMSKRAGATAISEYKTMGFMPEALVNYLMLLGWSPGANKEIVSLSEAVSSFDIRHANKTAATFDMDKLLWINGQYIRQADGERLAALLAPFLGEEKFDGKFLRSIIKLFCERASTLVDLGQSVLSLMREEVVYDPQARQKHLSSDLSRPFALLKDRFAAISEFNAAAIEESFRTALLDLQLTSKELIHPLRVALSGRTVGPGMFEMIEALGRERTLARMDQAMRLFKEGGL